MSPTEPPRHNLPTVLMVGPVPPPIGGIAAQVQLLLQSSLSLCFRLVHFDPETPLILAGTRPPLLWRLAASLRMMVRFISSMLSHRVRLVHLHASSFPGFYEKAFMGALARLLGRRVVFHLHGGGLEASWRRSRAKWLIALCLRIPDSVVVLSSGWKRVTWRISPKANVEIVPNMVDADLYRPVQRQVSGKVQILYVGWMIREKGVFDLITAVEKLREEGVPFEVHMVCDGRDRARIEEEVKSQALGDAVRLHGWQEGEAKLRFFRSADIFVLPTYSEGLPVVLLEAMAAGLPVVTTPVGAIPEVVTPGVHGELVEPGNPEALAAALIKLCRDKDLRTRYGLAGLERVHAEYDIERGAARVAAIYDRLLSRA